MATVRGQVQGFSSKTLSNRGVPNLDSFPGYYSKVDAGATIGFCREIGRSSLLEAPANAACG
jgi:hypothetical protein